MKFIFFILLSTSLMHASEPSHRHRRRKSPAPSTTQSMQSEHDQQILQDLHAELQAHLAMIERLAHGLEQQQKINTQLDQGLEQQKQINQAQADENRRLQQRIDTLYDMLARLSLRQGESRSGTHSGTRSSADSPSSTPLTRSPFTATASGYGFVDDD